jgi:hypothetical protein
MSAILDFLSNGASAIIAPVAGIFTKKIERKQAKDALHGQLEVARQSDATTIVVNDQHLETILSQATTTTWKDEYVTLSVVGVINALMLGGILQGFGYPNFLEGVIVGINAMIQAGVDLSFILNATIMAAIGLSIWRKA